MNHPGIMQPARVKNRDDFSWSLFVGLLAIKPFIDLTWDYDFLTVAGVDVNGTRLAGLLVFILACLALIQRPPVNVVGFTWILAFVACNVFTVALGYSGGELKLTHTLNVLLRLFDAYLIYLLFSTFWSSRSRLLTIMNVIWISTLLASVISLVVWYRGGYETDVSQGVERYAGLYNDPGVPSYNAVMSVVFAIAFFVLCRQYGRQPSGLQRALFVSTFFIAAAILGVTMTKNAILMIAIFAILWWGIFQGKHLIVVPLLLVSSWLVYLESEDVRNRVAPEVRVFVEGDFSDDALDAIGTGRYGVWRELLRYYADLSFDKQLLGIGRSLGAHNQYLAYLLRVGMVGLGCFLMMLVAFYFGLYWRFRMTSSPIIFLAMTLLTMFVAAGMTGHPFDYTTLYWYVLILISVVNAPPELIGRPIRRRAPSRPHTSYSEVT